MRRELVYAHRYLADRKDCATISVQSLIPHPISPKSVDALLNNTFYLRDVAAVVTDELTKYGLDTLIIEKRSDTSASRFFRNVAHAMNNKHLGLFVGGILAVELPNEKVDHMVAITSVHENENVKKATIVDPGPKKKGAPLIRKVPLAWLDRNIMKSEDLGPTAIALITIPCRKVSHNGSDNRDALIQRRIANDGRVFTYSEDEPNNAAYFSKKHLKREKRMKNTRT